MSDEKNKVQTLLLFVLFCISSVIDHGISYVGLSATSNDRAATAIQDTFR